MNSTGNTNIDQPSKKEMGLIKHLSRRNYTVERLTKELDLHTKVALKTIYEAGGNVYTYADQTKMTGSTYTYTKIEEYTNKKGKSHMAHYTPNGTYMGSVKAKGEEPVECMYQSYINEMEYVYDDEKVAFIGIRMKDRDSQPPKKKKKIIKKSK
tara:strand:- start:696 stop:1157 length:462 start_codon:yes stop_codon:yes gene_type:complete